MSVSQSPNAPKVPDLDAEDILEDLRQEYGGTEELMEEYDMDASDLVNWAYDLEPDEGDLDRQMHVLDIFQTLEEEYECSHWVNEADARFYDDKEGKVIYYGLLRDPDNEEAWISVSETEYVDLDE